jgi:hypothetical protein
VPSFRYLNDRQWGTGEEGTGEDGTGEEGTGGEARGTACKYPERVTAG